MNIYFTILFELLFISASILLLFKFRTKLGLGPLYIFLGAVLYLQSLSGSMVSFKILGNITIYPGYIILFSAILFAILLIYIKEGVSSARELIIGVILSNLLLSVLFKIISIQDFVTQNLNEIEPSSLFLIDYNYFIIGSIILLLDFILLVIVYQFLISKIRKQYFFLILFISLFTVLLFDSFAFNISLKYDSENFVSSLYGHVIGKSISALIFSIILYCYIKLVEPEGNSDPFLANKDRDIFSIIRYRKKYLNLKVEKQEVELKLAAQSETALNNISDGFVSLDTNWRYVFVNKRAGEILGRSPESLIGKHIWTEFPQAVGTTFYKAYMKAVESQETQYIVEYHEALDRWIDGRAYPSANGLTIYLGDITEEKRADKENNMLLSLIETSDNFVGLASLEGKPIYLNVNGRKLVGLESDETLPDSITDFFTEKYKDKILKDRLPNIYRTNKWRGEVQFKNFKTGAIIPIEMSGFLIKDSTTNNPMALGIVATDITTSNEAKEKLINSEQLFRRLSTNAPVAIFQTDKDGACNYINEAYVKYSGLSFEKALGYGWSNALHPEDKDRVLYEWQETVSKGVDLLTDFRFLHSNGEITWLTVKTSGLYDSNNQVYGHIGMLIDVTERKKAEDQIIKSEKYLNRIINNIGDPVFVKDEQSRLVTVNDAFCKIFNISRSDIIGKTLAEDVSADEKESFLSLDKQVLATGIENVNEEHLTVREGESKIISTKKTRFIDDSGNRFLIGTIRDITARKKTELELEKHRNNLEELIKIRTEEVNSKNEELQRMNKLFVGRELKMKELKNIIKELKSKSEN